MFPQPSFGSAGSFVLGLAAMGASVTGAALDTSAASGPCDIYAAGGTPCVAAHSTTRALFAAFSKPLYQVIRGSDNTTKDIMPLVAGGVANASVQDSFCSRTTCLISIIYDQSGRDNHLTQAPGGNLHGPDARGRDNLASAIGAPVTLNGNRAYGVFSPPGTGYRNNTAGFSNNTASGTARGDDPEGIYAVLDGTHFNDGCCYDYGNAENNTLDKGAGTMESINFSNITKQAGGAGSGPWLLADLENGIFSNQFGGSQGKNLNDPSITSRFFTMVLKGKHNQWALRGSDATSGSLTTFYNGVRPAGYTTMKKDGAIILGVGGDNSHAGQGTFYEGVMTSGFPSDDTENAVQANVVAAKYAPASLTSGAALAIGSSVSFRLTAPGLTTRFIAHSNSNITTAVVSSSSSSALKQQASFTVRTGLGNSACLSFESKDTPGSFIRHVPSPDFQLSLDVNDGTKVLAEDATWCPQAGLNGQGSSIRSWNNPTRWFRQFNSTVFAASNGGVHTFDDATSFNDDASFVVATGFA